MTSDSSKTLENIDMNMNEEVQLGARSRTLTPKYADYQLDNYQSNFKQSISTWRKQASKLERLQSDCMDISVLRKERDVLERNMEQLTNCYEKLSSLFRTSDTQTEQYYERYEQVEKENHLLMKNISECIREINSEAKSNSSGYSRASKKLQPPNISHPDRITKDPADDNSLTTKLLRLDFEPEDQMRCVAEYIRNAPVSPAVVADNEPRRNNTSRLNAHAQEFTPPSSKPNTSRNATNPPQMTQTVGDNTQLLDFVQLFAEQVSLQRLPTPEPGIFYGDPLRYPAWESAFLTLIERRQIPANERIYYLQKYIGGAAREAIDGFFLLSNESSYQEARDLLRQRYGDPFVIANAFRDKLESWPKITARDSLGLRKFADFLRQCNTAMTTVGSLNMLNDDRENRKMLTKLPEWLVPRWGRIVADWKEYYGRFPPFSEFSKFMTKEADIACDPVTSIHSLKTRFDNEGQNKIERKERKKTNGASSFSTEVRESTQSNRENGSKFTDSPNCILCNKGHHLDVCRTFLAKPLTERKDFAFSKGLCFGCLGQGHISKLCQNRKTCDICSKRHPTSLHGDTKEPAKRDVGDETKPLIKSTSSHTRVAHLSDTSSSNKCSMIVPVWLSHRDKPNVERLVYALLDTQSDTTFILDKTKSSLGLEGTNVKLMLSTMFAENKMVDSQRMDGLVVRGYNSSLKITLPVVYSRGIMPANRSHIPTPGKAKSWPHLKGIADKLMPLKNCEIGLLIGYNCSRALAPRDVIPPTDNGPYGQRTDLGWGIVGIVDTSSETDHVDPIGVSHRILTYEVPPNLSTRQNARDQVLVSLRTTVKEVISPNDIAKILEQDFSERKQNATALSHDDRMFLSKVTEGIHQRTDRHYEMPLPFKEPDPRLPNNRPMAMHRLKNLTRRLDNDTKYAKDYKAFMDNVIQNGYAERVPENEMSNCDGKVWYIPHHGVYHPKKPDKIRVVFDCSAKFKGESLNDHLLQGPDLTNTLIGVLCRFRKEKIALMCDVEQMFHQFSVNPEHRNFLRFLWWENGPVDFRMKVHLFGAVSSPGCANFGLKRAADDGEAEFGIETADFIRRNFYVDDGLQSVPTPAEAITLINNSKGLCAKAGLRLHKFVSNSKDVISAIPSEDCAKAIKDLDVLTDQLPIERALGIHWCVESDTFKFRVTWKDRPVTRRGVLSTVCSIYDPLGFLAPVILVGKQILQEACKDQMDWDSPLPEPLRLRWKNWSEDLINLEGIAFPRCFKPPDFGHVKSVELHHFSDASSSGYGQCSYIRMIDQNDNVHCTFVMGKARVIPMKALTIPRLELTAALLSIKVSTLLQTELKLDEVTEYFWTDSKVVLGYISNDSRRFHVFVANRIQQIRDSSEPSQWNYVKTDENPADDASRGLTATELLHSKWSTGPDFLWQREIPFKTQEVDISLSPDDVEVKKAKCFAVNTVTAETKFKLERLEYFSEWHRAKRAVAHCLKLKTKFRDHAVKKQSATSGTSHCQSLSVEELSQAEKEIIRLVQTDAFSEEIKALRSLRQNETHSKRFKHIKRSSRLYKLDPFLDSDGIIRVGGRIRRSSLSLSDKHPAILPRKHHITTLVIRHFHTLTEHQGRGMTVNEIRSNGYWIIGCSSAVSCCISKCVKCRKFRSAVQEQKMSDLPSDRLEPAPPFTDCGVDVFGPWLIKEGRREVKRYGVLFTCMVSRAIHIEVANSLSTDSFINALRRFISIRGPIRQLRSDQGTNFVGAQRELKEAASELDQTQVKDFLLKHNCDLIEFRMNTPSSSHKGGVWERLIRSVRNVLSSLLDQSGLQLDDESLRTVMNEAAAVVNGRPLTTDNLNDPTSLEPLSPNQLLTMKSKLILPPPGEFEQLDMYSRKRWRRVQHIANQFWLRWKKEFLQNLQLRQKWTHPRRNLAVGDVVIVKDDNLPRNAWQLARVHETYQDDDNRVRKVKLVIANRNLTKDGRRTDKLVLLERPVQKLVLLVENVS